MKINPRPWLLLPLLAALDSCSICGSSDDSIHGRPPREQEDGPERGAGGKTRRARNGDTEVIGLAIASQGGDATQGRVLVWIGDTGLTPSAHTPPTFDSGDWVGLPWRPGVDVSLDEATVAAGAYAVYAMLIEPRKDGWFRVWTDDAQVRVPEEGMTERFDLQLTPADHLPDLALLGARRTVPAGDEAELATRVIYILLRDQ